MENERIRNDKRRKSKSYGVERRRVRESMIKKAEVTLKKFDFLGVEEEN